ncbi:FecR domain-containing protein [Chitinophaga horti]|uniref:FecR domain-containing protein n=1 Tax=Chitinophaga horti TaxID=2920382 RepID=A0ABY6IVP4_9BACT|nr:FecR family protein [Chitinophaga horti]UYQ91440.1 FecR domain-containing protein [Chitinophaga horti]
MEHKARLTYLLERLANNTATDAELEELSVLIGRDEPGAGVEDAEEWLEAHSTQELPPYDRSQWMQMASQILKADKLPAHPEVIVPRPRVHFLHRWWWAAAAVVVMAAGVWMLKGRQTQPMPVTASLNVQDVEPGSFGAVLTLADGSQMVLDSAGNGILTKQNGTTVILKNDGLQYTPGSENASEPQYNTITTSKGRSYNITLPDGTKVWLNAESSLRFPVAFNGNNRAVEFSGEAYFDVQTNAMSPFIVKVSGKVDVEVLGTQFNISAYANEQTSYTTLITGAVKVTPSGKAPLVLKPGDQLQHGAGGTNVISNTNMDKAIAWKNGLFNFDGVGLREMMRQLERWYDLEVVYEGNVPDVVFFGEMSRKLKLSDVLSGLERSDVHFRLEEGRRLIVMP